jgi:hypothetical protein
MELNSEVARYVVGFHDHLMTDVERRTQRHLFATMKATKGRSGRAAQVEARKSKVLSKLLSDEPNVLQLVRDGHREFEMRTAARILRDSGDKVFLNCCPRCGELARTPTAKQCRCCGNDWHTE